MSKIGERGKWAEKQVKEWCEERSAEDSQFAFHRLPDARAARGALAAQPADFIIASNGPPVWLEVKETSNPKRLALAKISQFGSLKSFWWAGMDSHVLIYRSPLNDWVYLDSAALFTAEDAPPSFVTQNLKSYLNVNDILKELFP